MYLLSKQIPTQSNKDNYKKYTNMNLSNQRNAERNYYKEQFDLHKGYILNIPGYKHKHYIRSNKRGGGVSMYILNMIPYKTRKNLS